MSKKYQSGFYNIMFIRFDKEKQLITDFEKSYPL